VDLNKARYGRVTHKTAPGPSQKNPIKYRELERPRAFMLAPASAGKIGLESYPSPRRRCRQVLHMWRHRAYATRAAAVPWMGSARLRLKYYLQGRRDLKKPLGMDTGLVKQFRTVKDNTNSDGDNESHSQGNAQDNDGSWMYFLLTQRWMP